MRPISVTERGLQFELHLFNMNRTSSFHEDVPRSPPSSWGFRLPRPLFWSAAYAAASGTRRTGRRNGRDRAAGDAAFPPNLGTLVQELIEHNVVESHGDHHGDMATTETHGDHGERHMATIETHGVLQVEGASGRVAPADVGAAPADGSAVPTSAQTCARTRPGGRRRGSHGPDPA